MPDAKDLSLPTDGAIQLPEPFSRYYKVSKLSFPVFLKFLQGYMKYIPDDITWLDLANRLENPNNIFLIFKEGWVLIESIRVKHSAYIHASKWDETDPSPFYVEDLISSFMKELKLRRLYTYVPSHASGALKFLIGIGFKVQMKFPKDQSYAGKPTDVILLSYKRRKE